MIVGFWIIGIQKPLSPIFKNAPASADWIAPHSKLAANRLHDMR